MAHHWFHSQTPVYAGLSQMPTLVRSNRKAFNCKRERPNQIVWHVQWQPRTGSVGCVHSVEDVTSTRQLQWHKDSRSACNSTAYLLQRIIASSFAAHCGSHKHEAMAHQGGLIQLDALGNKAVYSLQAHLLTCAVQSLQQIIVFHLISDTLTVEYKSAALIQKHIAEQRDAHQRQGNCLVLSCYKHIIQFQSVGLLFFHALRSRTAFKTGLSLCYWQADMLGTPWGVQCQETSL